MLSTYTRVLLSDWRDIANLMVQDAKQRKETAKKDEFEELVSETKGAKTLTLQQLDDILNGPYYSFYQPILHAYAKILRIQLEFNVVNNEVFKLNRQTNPEYPPITEKFLKKLNPTDVDQAIKNLGSVAKEFHETWEQDLMNWKHLLLEELNKNLQFSDLEIENFLAAEPISEVREQLIHLKIQEPKHKTPHVNFSHFLQLKTRLLVHSCLSRQHQPHDESKIASIIKSLKHAFDSIDKQEKKLSEELGQAANETSKKFE